MRSRLTVAIALTILAIGGSVWLTGLPYILTVERGRRISVVVECPYPRRIHLLMSMSDSEDVWGQINIKPALRAECGFIAFTAPRIKQFRVAGSGGEEDYDPQTRRDDSQWVYLTPEQMPAFSDTIHFKVTDVLQKTSIKRRVLWVGIHSKSYRRSDGDPELTPDVSANIYLGGAWRVVRTRPKHMAQVSGGHGLNYAPAPEQMEIFLELENPFLAQMSQLMLFVIGALFGGALSVLIETLLSRLPHVPRQAPTDDRS